MVVGKTSVLSLIEIGRLNNTFGHAAHIVTSLVSFKDKRLEDVLIGF